MIHGSICFEKSDKNTIEIDSSPSETQKEMSRALSLIETPVEEKRLSNWYDLVIPSVREIS